MIEIGEYIRTPYHKIEKIKKIKQEDGWICVTTDKNAYELEWLKTNKVKHSKNIIDLVESGDYVNGIPIEDIEEIDNKKVFYSNGEMIAWTNRDKGIETILTKEQYMQNCYKCQYIENGTI